MEKQLSMINDITPNTPRGWKVKVLVLEKLPLRKPTSDSPYTLQRFILADSNGTKVQATIFNKDIALFKDELVPLSKYYISNARVRVTPKTYQMVDNKYQWTIYYGTLIDKVDDETDATSTNLFNFIPILELANHRQGMNTVDVLVIALEILPAKEQITRKGPVSIQEIIVIDSSLKPIIFTLWGHFTNTEGPSIAALITNMPILAAMRVQASSYNGVSISTWGTSSLMIELEIPDTINLRQWCMTNQTLIQDLMNSPTYLALAKRLGSNNSSDIIEISKLTSYPDNMEFQIKCSLELVDLRNLYFIACSNCHKSTTAQIAEKFRCLNCKVAGVEGIPICRASVKATDASGSIDASLFGEDAEKFLQCDAQTIIANMKQVDAPDVKTYIKSCSEEEQIYNIKAYHTEFRGNFTRKFKISYLKFSNIDDNSTPENIIESSNEAVVVAEPKQAGLVEIGVTTTMPSSHSTPQADIGVTLTSVKSGDKTKGKAPKSANQSMLYNTRSSKSIASQGSPA